LERHGPLRLLLILCTAITLIAAGCRPSTDGDTAEGLAARGDRALADGDASGALDFYSRALALDPDHPRAALWSTGTAYALRDLGRYEEALLAVREAVSSAPDPLTRNGAILLEAMIEFDRNACTNSMDRLADLDPEMLDRERAQEAEELAMDVLDRLDVRTVSTYRTDNWLEVFVLLAMEWKYAEQGDFEHSTLYGMEIDRLYPDAHERYGSPVLAPSEGAFFAVVLPLTGEGSVYATDILNGVTLAFDRFAELHQAAPEMVVFDTGAEGADLTSVMRTLGGSAGCLGVLGPLTSSSTLAAAPLAVEYGLPLVSPSATSSSIDDYDRYVHRLVISQGDQAASVAEYAVLTAGCSRLCIIHEYTAESVAESEQFTTVVEELGAEVVAMEGYQPETTDFKNQIMAVKAWRPDGIFLPVSAWDAVQIAPQLRFYSLDIPMFGTSGWDSELLIRLGEEYVEGAVFTVGFGAGSLYPVTARFVYNYERTFGATPTSMAAQGYDTAEILLEAWDGRTHTRTSIERALQSMRPYYGASGRCTLGSGSIARTSYPLLTIIDGEIVSVE
jgi:branched-chain amino acid transport system substrate-binding protein